MMIASVFAVAVSFSGAAAGAGAAGNASLSLNSAGNQATVTVDDPDLNTAANTKESTVVNIESTSEQPTTGSKQTSSDTSDSSTQTISVSPASLVADRNNDGSISKADFALTGASDEQIKSVTLNSGAYDVTIEDTGSSTTDSNAETVTYTKLTAEVTSSDTGESSSTTLTTNNPVADRNGDGDITEADVKLGGASDESITSFSTNGNGTATLTIDDAGTNSESSPSPEQLAYLRREPVTLSETGQDTGTFTGTIDIKQSDSDGVLKAQDGDSITAIYWEDGTTKRTDSQTLSLTGGDTTAPSISSVGLSESSDNMDISFDSDEQLGTSAGDIAATVVGPNGKTYSFDRTSFTESGSGPYTYTLSTTQTYDDGDGTYTVSVDDAKDAAGNNGGNNGDGSGLTDTYDYTSSTDTWINGTVTNASGAAVDSAFVIAVPASGGSSVTGTTDSNGDYSLEIQPGTTYEVIVDDEPDYPFKIKTGISVSSSNTKTVDFQLEAFPAKGFINGTVLDSDGDAVASGVPVSARDLGYQFSGQATTDSNGEFSLELPASNYIVRAQSSNGPPKMLDNVTVEEGQTTNVTIQFPETGYITGTVEDASGNKVGGVGVVADNGDQIVVDTSNTSQQPSTGAYNVTAPPGNYTVSVFAKGKDAESKQVTVTGGSEAGADFTLRKTSIKHTSVEVVEGSGVDTSNLGIKASVLSGMLQVKLTNQSGGGGGGGVGGPPAELDGLGVSKDTKLRMNITVTNFTASSLMWGIDDARWSTSDNASVTNGTDITVTGTPTQLQVKFSQQSGGVETGIGPLMNKDPSEVSWPTGRDDRATAGRNLTVYFGIFDLSNMPGSVRNNLNGMSVTTNAQRFSTPSVVNESLRVWVAAPTKTVAGNDHGGFYQAEIPDSQLDEWGIDDPESELNALYKGDTTNFTVTETDTGARVRLDNISYSAGFAEVEANPSSGGDSGGGSSGSSTSDRTAATVTRPASGSEDGSSGAAIVTIDNTETGDPVEVDLDGVGTDDVSVEGVSAAFDMGTTIDNEMSVEANTDPPSSVPTYTDGDVKSYLTVEVEGNLANRVTGGSFTFQVAGDETPADPTTVTVFRYHNDEWQPVETRHLGGNRFEAVTPGYSTFAIAASGETDQAATPTVTPTATVTVTASSTATVTPTTTSTRTVVGTEVPTPTATTTETSVESGTTETATPTSGASGPGFGAVVVLIALALVALAARRP